MANYNINSRLYNGKDVDNILNKNIINKSTIYKFSNFTSIMFFLLVLVNYSLSHGTENKAVYPRLNYFEAEKFINRKWAIKKALTYTRKKPALVLGVVKGDINDEFKIANVRCKIEDNKIVQLDNICSNKSDYLGFGNRQYAIFAIVTEKRNAYGNIVFLSDTIYVYSSDINSLTQDILYDRGMFAKRDNLSQVEVIACDTNNVIDMNSMFAYCSNLTELNLSSFNTENVTNMYWMFAHCSKLTNLDLSSFNTNKVTNMSRMFFNCYSLTNLNISNFNTTKVTDMNWMFYNCSSLTNLDLSNLKTDNVEDMSYMFYNCSSLTNIIFPNNFNTNKVTNMSCMFQNCSSLTNINLSSFNTINVTDMLGMFCNCSSLTELNLSNFNTDKVTKMNGMFCDCKSLTNLDLSSFNTNKVTNMSNMFKNCNSLTSIKFTDKFNTNNATKMYCMFFQCFTEQQPSTLICKASTIKKITDKNASCLTITNENENKEEINEILNNNPEQVYTCSVERVGENSQITAVEEYQQQ